MDKDIIALLRKFIANECSAAELEQVNTILNNGHHQEEWGAVLEELAIGHFLGENDNSATASFDREKLLSRIQSTTGVKQKKRSLIAFTRVAAAACIVLAGAAFWFYSAKKNATAETVAHVKTQSPNVTEHRFIKLPDGSKVLLNDSSTLQYPNSFTGSTREVTLIGEAFFDVAHDSRHPFIIHTGDITTTVLGTAFNIKAFKNDRAVTVTVTRGKVRVQKGAQVLGILMPNQQISYNIPTMRHLQQNVNAERTISWKQSDLILDDVDLKEAAEVISKQYGMKVMFKNSEVMDCRFSATFLNGSKLEQVLTVIGEITNTRLLINKNTIEIDGPGC